MVYLISSHDNTMALLVNMLVIWRLVAPRAALNENATSFP